MSLSSIDLSDPSSVQRVEGRSLAFFCKKKPVRVDGRLVAELKQIAAGLDGKNLRLCLHEGPEALFHDMLILEHKGNYYRPHKHLAKGESFHIIEGSMGIFVFDEPGRVVDACTLEPQGDFLYRIDTDMYHAVMPLSELVIYHESKPGPFTGEGDSLFPSWAPDGSDADELRRYTDSLLRTLVRGQRSETRDQQSTRSDF